MTCDTYPSLLTPEARPGGLIGPQGKPVRTMLALSVAVHVALLVIATSLRIAPSFERPLASYQISLVDLASPRHPAPRVSREAVPRPVSVPAPVTPPEAAAPPTPDRLPDLPPAHRAERAERTEIAQPQKASPVSLEPLPPPAARSREPRSPLKLREALQGIELPPEVPRVTPAPVKPVAGQERARPNRTDDRLREALQGIELPPEAPKVAASPTKPLAKEPQSRAGQPDDQLREALQRIDLPPEAPAFEDVRREIVPVTPTPKPAKPQTNVQTLLSQLKVPEAPVLPTPAPESVHPAPESHSRPSLSEELAKQLARLPAAQPATLRPPVASKQPAQESQTTVVSKAAGPLKPGARIQVPGLAPGFSHYLARIQNEISKKWIAPQVEAPEGAIQVVIRFRLDRSGTVSLVEIEQASGNEYYDLAGKRAVLSAYPLPPFPNDLPHAYLDAHFSFTVGGQTG